MKKLLSITNVICILSVLISCSNENQIEDVIDSVNEERIDPGSTRVDSLSQTNPTETSGTIGLDGGSIKDSTSKSLGQPQAIHHGSPDQAKLDSIKAGKLKLKNQN